MNDRIKKEKKNAIAFIYLITMNFKDSTNSVIVTYDLKKKEDEFFLFFFRIKISFEYIFFIVRQN